MTRIVATQVDSDVEHLLLPQSGIESEPATAVPVAVYVHRHGGAHARQVVVGGLVVYAVAGGVEPQPRVDAFLLLSIVGVETGVDVVRERRFQFRVSFRDDEWVGVVLDVEQVGHARLSGTPVVAYMEVGVLV